MEKLFVDLPPLEMPELHVLQIAIRGSFSDIWKYSHTADMLAQRRKRPDNRVLVAVFVCVITISCFGRVVSVIKVFRPKAENALLGHFRPKIFGGRNFGASLENMLVIDENNNVH